MFVNVPKKKASHPKPINAAVSLLMVMLPRFEGEQIGGKAKGYSREAITTSG